MTKEAQEAIDEFVRNYVLPGDREQAKKELGEIVEDERERGWNEGMDNAAEEAYFAEGEGGNQ